MARSFRPTLTSSAPRFLRVDFHPTPTGYQITEANSDVAGGFIEGSGITALWEDHADGRRTGDPAGALATALLTRFGRGARVGLLHLTRYTDDRQVVAYLGRRFDEAGLHSVLFDALQLRSGLRAHVTAKDYDAIAKDAATLKANYALIETRVRVARDSSLLPVRVAIAPAPPPP